MIRLITQDTLNNISIEAAQSPRLRKNLNFHQHNAAQCQRLLNALEPNTYVQPHRHLDPEKEETMIVLRGRFGLLIFDALGNITDKIILSPTDNALGITIPVGTFHSMIALESGSVFFEAKAGPYVPISTEEKAVWAPNEGELKCKEFLLFMEAAFL